MSLSQSYTCKVSCLESSILCYTTCMNRESECYRQIRHQQQVCSCQYFLTLILHQNCRHLHKIMLNVSNPVSLLSCHLIIADCIPILLSSRMFSFSMKQACYIHCSYHCIYSYQIILIICVSAIRIYPDLHGSGWWLQTLVECASVASLLATVM